MEIPMRNIILTGVAALAFATIPAFAQDSGSSADTSADASADTSTQPADQAAPSAQSADEANAQATPAPPTTTVQTDAATGAGEAVTNYGGNLTPPPASALNKTYPVCRGAVQDECQNPGEGGAPGRSRALPYWPGKPSEGGH